MKRAAVSPSRNRFNTLLSLPDTDVATYVPSFNVDSSSCSSYPHVSSTANTLNAQRVSRRSRILASYICSSVKPYEIQRPESHIVIPVQLSQKEITVTPSALIDSGATASFIHPRLVQEQGLVTCKKEIPMTLRVIDGRDISSGKVDKEVRLRMKIGSHQEEITLDVADIGNHPLILGIPWLKTHNPTIDWPTHRVSFTSPLCAQTCLDTRADILGNPSGRSTFPTVNATTVSDEELAQIKKLVPEAYYEFADVFSKKESEVLPPHRPYDLKLDFKPNEPLPRPGGVFPLAEDELKELHGYLDEQLRKGFIEPSNSPLAAPVFYVKKKDGSKRLVIDYRRLNNAVVGNQYPLPLTNEIIDRLKGAKLFTKLDLRWGYNLVRIAKGDEWKTAFKTRYGLFQWNVMTFGHKNAPGVFQQFMNEVFHDMLDKNVINYIDDFCIYINRDDPIAHQEDVKEVLRRLRRHGLFVKPEKCLFGVKEMEFLGLWFTEHGVEMEKGKVDAVLNWPTLKNVKDVQQFLGFANFYRRFIRGFSRMSYPLSKLTRKKQRWIWTEAQQEAFDALKKAFTTAPVLAHPDPSKPFIIEADASKYAYGGILSQKDDEGKLRPIAFMSKSMTPAERNYDIYDKEMLAIIRALESWRHHLSGARHKITILSDHKNLEYFLTPKVLSYRQLRWIEHLAHYDFVIIYRAGHKSGKPDALSRRPDHRPEGGDETRERTATLLKPEQFLSVNANQLLQLSDDHSILQRIQEALTNDVTTSAIRAFFASDPDSAPASVREKMKDFAMDDGLLLYRNKIYVPADEDIKRDIVALRHDSPLAGHPGLARTLEMVQREYHWPSMKAFVGRYVEGCELCQRTKYARTRPAGLLQPLPVPEGPWQSIGYDYIPDLPVSHGKNNIFTVVDLHTKMAHFAPCTTRVTASDTADLLIQNVVRLHGVPQRTVSDRGTQFNSAMLKHFWKRLGVQPNFSTAYHPQTNGQSERANQEVEQYLRIFVNHHQDDWVDWLPLAEFAFNNRFNESIGMSPFYALSGYHPSLSTLPSSSQSSTLAEERIADLERIHKELKSALTIAKERQEFAYNQYAREQPQYEIGDKVWLETTNLSTDRPSHKLGDRRIGPFPIEKKISNTAYRLTLPATMRNVHPVFHVHLLTPHRTDTIAGRRPPPPRKVTIPQGADQVVRTIRNSRWLGNELQYEVRWQGQPAENDSWETAERLAVWPANLQKIEEFHRTFPQAWSLTRRPLSRSARHPPA